MFGVGISAKYLSGMDMNIKARNEQPSKNAIHLKRLYGVDSMITVLIQ